MDNHWAAGKKDPRPAVRSDVRPDLTDLCELYLKEPGNAQIREQFGEECMKVLRKKINYLVIYRRTCPKFLAPDTFAKDVFSLALAKFWAGIRSLRNPTRLNPWLGRVASSSVYEELRQFTRRMDDGPCEWKTIETMRVSEDGNILDEEADRLLADSAISRHAGEVKRFIHRDILDKVLGGSGGDDRDWITLQLSMEFEVDEIAERLGMAEPKVRYRLKKARRRFRIIAKHRHRFGRSDI